MKFNTKSAFSVFLAVMVAMAAITGGALAAPSTTTDSEVDSDSTLILDPSSDEVETLQFEVTNANTDSITVTVADNSTGITEHTLTDADAALTEVSTDVWEANLTHSAIANTTEHAVGETYELDVTIEHDHDDDGDGAITTATTSFTTDAEIVSTADEQTVLVDDSVETLATSLDVEEASDGTIFGIGAEEFGTYEMSNNHPNGDGAGYNNTTYVLSGDVASAYDDAAGDVDAGDSVYGMTVFVQGEAVPVYADEAGDIHDDGDSYAVYDTDTSELTVELGDDRADALSTDVTVVNNDILSETSFGDVKDMYGLTTALGLMIPFDAPW